MAELIVFYIYTFLQGCIVGSFLNVVIDRLPAGESLMGRSHCDACQRHLSPWELIPVVSYIAQGARTRCCQRPLKIQYPAVELLVGGLFFLIAYLYILMHQLVILTLPDIATIAMLCVIMGITIAIAGIDFRHHIIPDSLQIALIIAALLYRLVTHTFTIDILYDGFVVAIPILALFLITRGRGMGFGDVKLEVGLGIWLGISTGLLGIYAGFITGAIYGITLIALHQAHRRSHIAFGPFLLLGAWWMYWCGTLVLKMYMQLLSR